MQATIAERLRARTRQLGLSPPQLAAQAGVNRSYVYDILRGRSENPNLEKLERIAVPERKELVARFSFPEPQRSSRVVVEVEGVAWEERKSCDFRTRRWRRWIA